MCTIFFAFCAPSLCPVTPWLPARRRRKGFELTTLCTRSPGLHTTRRQKGLYTGGSTHDTLPEQWTVHHGAMFHALRVCRSHYFRQVTPCSKYGFLYTSQPHWTVREVCTKFMQLSRNLLWVLFSTLTASKGFNKKITIWKMLKRMFVLLKLASNLMKNECSPECKQALHIGHIPNRRTGSSMPKLC